MQRSLLCFCFALAATLAGCTPSEPGDGAHAVPEQAGSAAPVAAATPAVPATPPAATDIPAAAPGPQGTGTVAAATPTGTAAAGAPTAGAVGPTAKDGQPAGGGRQAKPGWCAQDTDCPGGQVCEPCQGEKCCTAGCRSDSSCGKGQRCKQVTCVRAPCPSLCQ